MKDCYYCKSDGKCVIVGVEVRKSLCSNCRAYVVKPTKNEEKCE